MMEDIDNGQLAEPPAVDQTQGQDTATTEPQVEDTSTEGQTEEHHDPAGDLPKGVTKRIAELTAQRHAADRRAALAEENLKRALELASNARDTTAPPPPEPKPVVVPPPVKPRRADFQDPDAYDEALTEYAAAEASRRFFAQQAAAKAKADQEAATAKQNATLAEYDRIWEEQKSQGAVKYTDFDEVIGAKDLAVNMIMRVALNNESNGADIAYHLGKNPKEAERIYALSPEKAVAAIAKLSVKLEEKHKTSSAPPPVKPLGTRSTSSTKSLDDMSMDELHDYFYPPRRTT